jgi:hypothetical protein
VTPADDTGDALKVLGARLQRFNSDARAALGTVEGSAVRVMSLEASYGRLKSLNVKQDDLLRQSLRCVEHELYRAAHVLAFAALMDFIEERLSRNRCNAVRKVRDKWKVFRVEDLREIGSDFQVIEVLRETNQCSKTQEKALKGLLNRRNESAHPSDYYPDLNETLGFIAEVMNRVGGFQQQWARKSKRA